MKSDKAAMRLRSLVTLLGIVACCTPARAEEAGTKDSTGLVWSQSQRVEADSWFSWEAARVRAREYTAWDIDAEGEPTLYRDWRLPTIEELRGAIEDGTMNLLVPRTPLGPYYYSVEIWAQDNHRGQAWTVLVVRDFDNATSTGTLDVIPELSGEAFLRDKRSSFNEVFLVRGKRPSRR
jgi:hypothetical protein